MSRSPSIKKLIEAFKLDKAAAGELKSLMISANNNEAIEAAMEKANILLKGHGIEVIWGNNVYWPCLEYVNMGDTYNITLCYERNKDNFFIGTWGDYVERHPALLR
jgi:hypothetical protein